MTPWQPARTTYHPSTPACLNLATCQICRFQTSSPSSPSRASTSLTHLATRKLTRNFLPTSTLVTLSRCKPYKTSSSGFLVPTPCVRSHFAMATCGVPTTALAVATVTVPTIIAPTVVTTVAVRRYHRVPPVALVAAPEALIAGLITTFHRRILGISLNASNFGANKVSQRRLVYSLL